MRSLQFSQIHTSTCLNLLQLMLYGCTSVDCSWRVPPPSFEKHIHCCGLASYVTPTHAEIIADIFPKPKPSGPVAKRFYVGLWFIPSNGQTWQFTITPCMIFQLMPPATMHVQIHSNSTLSSYLPTIVGVAFPAIPMAFLAPLCGAWNHPSPAQGFATGKGSIFQPKMGKITCPVGTANGLRS